MLTLKNYNSDAGGEVSALFPKPLYSNHLNRDFSNDEVQCFTDIALSTERNKDNSISTNAQVLNDNRLSNLKKWFELCINDYFKNIISSEEDITPFITTSWLNFTKRGESHHEHAHPNSIISSVFYIDTDITDQIQFHKEEAYDAPIMFSVNDKDYNTFNSKSWWLPVQTGKLILFPSSLRHSVPPVTSNRNRISLSLNVFVRGVLGSERDRTLLHLN